MAKLSLNYGDYREIPEGQVVLKITNAEAKPKARPKHIVIDYVDTNGGTKQEKYDLSNKTAVFAFTMVLTKASGYTDPDIDPADLNKLLKDKYFLAEVKHTVKDKVKDGVKVPGETTTFVNIRKALAPAKGFELAETDDVIDLDEDDDIAEEVVAADDIDLDDDDDDDFPI